MISENLKEQLKAKGQFPYVVGFEDFLSCLSDRKPEWEYVHLHGSRPFILDGFLFPGQSSLNFR